MTFEINAKRITIIALTYVTWYEGVIHRDETANLVKQYRDYLEKLEFLRIRHVPENDHWVPQRMEQIYEQLSYLSDRLDKVFTFNPNQDGALGHQFNWMMLLERKLIQRHNELESTLQWMPSTPAVEDKQESAPIPFPYAKREYQEKKALADRIVRERTLKHSQLRREARERYAEAREKQKMADLFDNIEGSQFHKKLKGEADLALRRANYAYAMFKKFETEKYLPAKNRYREVFFDPQTIEVSALAISLDLKREAERASWMDAYFTERELPGHRQFVCPTCSYDEEEGTLQLIETSYVDAMCHNPRCMNHGDKLVELGEYQRLMRREDYRDQVLQAQAEYRESTSYENLLMHQAREQWAFERLHKLNNNPSLIKRVYARLSDQPVTAEVPASIAF
jgi:hypothetical protein